MKIENYRGNHKSTSKSRQVTAIGDGVNARRRAEINTVAEEGRLSVVVRGNSTAVLNQFVRGWV